MHQSLFQVEISSTLNNVIDFSSSQKKVTCKSDHCDCKFELNAWRKIISEGDFETIRGLGNSLRKMYVLKEGWIRGKNL